MSHVRYRSELTHDGKRYFCAYVVLGIEPFLLVPLLLEVLGPAQLGVLGAVEALVVVLCGLSQLGVKFSYLQHVADAGREGRGFWTATVLTCAAGCAAGAVAAPLLDAAAIVQLLGASPDVGSAVLAALLVVTNLQMMLVTDLRARREPLLFVAASLIRVVAVVLLIPVFAGRMGSAVEAVLLAQVAALACSSTVLLRWGNMPRMRGFDPALARAFLAYGWPIALGSLVKYGTDALLPWLCVALVSPAAAGAMAVALKTSALFDSWFGLPFLMSWGGRVYDLAKERTVAVLSRRLFAEVTVATAAAALLSGVAGTVLLMFTIENTGVRSEALALLPLAVLGRALFMLRSPASVGQVAARAMGWHTRYSLAGLAVFAVVAPAAFRQFGAVGGWSVLVCIEAATVAYLFWRGHRMLRETAYRTAVA